MTAANSMSESIHRKPKMYSFMGPFQIVIGTAAKEMITEIMTMALTALASWLTWAWLMDVELGSCSRCSVGSADVFELSHEGLMSARTAAEMLNDFAKPVWHFVVSLLTLHRPWSY